ncbi:MAG: hypothetical protein LBP22_02990 [Deltaproteobacteria bacterium]|nr:hypothetical protein [Deltaproteobacteria bacterium]
MYAGRLVTGLLMFFSLGGLGIWALKDFFSLLRLNERWPRNCSIKNCIFFCLKISKRIYFN